MKFQLQLEDASGTVIRSALCVHQEIIEELAFQIGGFFARKVLVAIDVDGSETFAVIERDGSLTFQ